MFTSLPSALRPDVIPASRRHPCVPPSFLPPDVIPASRRHSCLPPSSLRKQGSRRINVCSHPDPRVREDGGEKIQIVLLRKPRRRESRRTISITRTTALAKMVVVVARVELVQLLDPCLRRDDGCCTCKMKCKDVLVL